MPRHHRDTEARPVATAALHTQKSNTYGVLDEQSVAPWGNPYATGPVTGWPTFPRKRGRVARKGRCRTPSSDRFIG